MSPTPAPPWPLPARRLSAPARVRRTDTGFKQNLDVTAVFGTASVQITSEGKGAVGSSYTFKAALSGKYAKTENLRWYANGQEVTQAAGKSSITVLVDSSMANASYKIHAVVTYNDCKVSSNTLTCKLGQLFEQHQRLVAGIVRYGVRQLQGRAGVRKQGRV